MRSVREKLLTKICDYVGMSGFESERDNIFARWQPNGIVNRIIVPIDVPVNRDVFSCTVNLGLSIRPGQSVYREGIAGYPSRLSVNIGSFMPQRRWHSWDFSASDLKEELVRQITLSIHRYALPWFERFENIGDLVRASREETFIARRMPLLNSFGSAQAV